MIVLDKIFEFVDGNLSEVERESVKKLITSDKEWKAAYQEVMKLHETLGEISNPKVDPMILVNMKLQLSLHGGVKSNQKLVELPIRLIWVPVFAMIPILFIIPNSENELLKAFFGVFSHTELFASNSFSWLGGSVLALLFIILLEKVLLKWRKNSLGLFSL